MENGLNRKAVRRVRLSQEEMAITRMIASRVARGQSLEHIARTSRLAYSRVRNLARLAGIRYKHRRATPEQIKGAIDAVRNRGATFRAAAQAFGMSRSAVHRFVQARRQRSIDAAGELKLVDGNREFSRHKRSWRCAVHGRVTVWPCVACAAIGARQ